MRPYLKNNYNSGVTQIIIYKAPASTKILRQNDKFRVGEGAQEYTVTTGDVTTDGNGEATINFTPGLTASYNADTALQIPFPRIMTDDMRTKVASETSTLIYFTKFEFDDIYRIENITNNGGGTIKITKTAHGLNTNDEVTIDLPNEYAGEDYSITKVDNDNFTVVKAFSASAPTTGTYDVKAPLYVTTAPHDITWDSQTWQGIGGMLHFTSVTESRDIKSSGVEFTFSGVEQSFLATLLGKAYAARYVTHWGGHVNGDGTILCDSDKDVFYRGKMLSDFEIRETREEDGNSTGTVEITFKAGSRLIITDSATGLQTNVDSHHQYEPDSKLFDQIPKLINKPIKWGKLPKPKGGGCLFWGAMAASVWYGISKDHPLLETLRQFRDTKMEKGIAVEYKRISPIILTSIEKYPCKNNVYKWIIAGAEKAASAIKEGNDLKAKSIYHEIMDKLEKLVG